MNDGMTVAEFLHWLSALPVRQVVTAIVVVILLLWLMHGTWDTRR